MKKINIFKPAFSLIEAVLVVAIILVLTLLSIAGLSYSSRLKQVKNTAENLRNVIIEARSLALASSENVYDLDKIQIRIFPGQSDPTKTIEIYQIKIDGTAERIEKTIEIPSNITIEPAAVSNLKFDSVGNYYYFSFLGRNLPSSSPNQIGQVTDYSDPSLPITINVNFRTTTWQAEVDLYTGNVEINKL
ncbi:MAG: hypothetical protein AAB785_02695 [Patescibacteria group bacterium]